MHNQIYTESEIKAWDIMCKAGIISDQYSTVNPCGIKAAADKLIELAEKIKVERNNAILHALANPQYYAEQEAGNEVVVEQDEVE